jgi:hypothetical protein
MAFPSNNFENTKTNEFREASIAKNPAEDLEEGHWR